MSVINKFKFLKLLARAVFFLQTMLSVFFCTTGSAFLYETSIWINPANGKLLFLGKDFHNLGTKEQNLKQLKRFLKDIIHPAEAAGIPLTVFFEGLMYNFVELNDAKLNDAKVFDSGMINHHEGVIEVPYYRLHSNGREYTNTFEMIRLRTDPQETTWIFHELPKALKVGTRKSVLLQNIDPRLPSAFMWSDSQPVATFQELFQMQALKNEDELLLISDEFKTQHPKLVEEIRKIDQEITKDRVAIVKFVEEMERSKYPDAAPIECHDDLALCNFAGRSTIRAVQEKLDANFDLFLRTLDKHALWAMAKPDSPQYSFLLAGGAHISAIESHLKMLGYVSRHHSKKIMIDSAIKPDQIGRLLIPDQLEHVVERSFRKIHRKLHRAFYRDNIKNLPRS